MNANSGYLVEDPDTKISPRHDYITSIRLTSTNVPMVVRRGQKNQIRM